MIGALLFAAVAGFVVLSGGTSAGHSSGEAEHFRFTTFEPPPFAPRFEDPPEDAALPIVDMGRIWFEHVDGTTQFVIEIRNITGNQARACDWRGRVSLDTSVLFDDPFLFHLGWRLIKGEAGSAWANANGPTVPALLEVTPGSPGFIRITADFDSYAWNEYQNRYFRAAVECNHVQDEFGRAYEGTSVPGLSLPTSASIMAAVLALSLLRSRRT